MAGLEDIFEDQLDTRKIIKCINNIDLVGLKSFLLNTNLDITKMTDENGFTLIILAAYVNSEKVMKLLVEHFKEKMNQFSVFSSDGSADKLPQQDQVNYNANILKAWVNRATLPGKEETKEPKTATLHNTSSLSEDLDAGFTALHYASYHGNPAMIDLLLTAGADMYAINDCGINMLHVAAQGDSPYSIAFFLRHSFLGINSIDRSGSTPLHWACISHSHAVVRFLLAWGADVERTDIVGYTPMHLALRDLELDNQKSFQTILLLKQYKAPMLVLDNLGKTPIDYVNAYTDEPLQFQVLRTLD